MTVQLSDIETAALAIKGHVVHTPFLHSRTLSQIVGADVLIKFENLQFTATFKERGALNKLLSLTVEERARGVVAMSAGNHAQGVAYHAERLGIPATIVMPETTPFVKVQQTADFGAHVILKGADFAEATVIAKDLSRAEGFIFVHPFDDEKVIAGAGTIGLELAQSGAEFDTVVVPVGGGGLISGIATAVKALKPATRVIGVEAELFPSMQAALKGEAPQCGGVTIAEGIAVARAGELTREICARLVDEVLIVSETSIERAIYLMLTVEKTVVEGAGAAGFAALLQHKDKFAGRRVALVVPGGNIDARLLASVIMRELSRDGRILKISVDVEDLPGQLGRVTRAIGEARGSILDVHHSRLALDISAKHTLVECMVEARDSVHADEICAAIDALGFKVRRMS
jgi:threonine dehydratase